MWPLFFYTELPELWNIFQDIVAISSVDSNGLLTLSGMQVYLSTVDFELSVDNKVFFDVMSIFLIKYNERIIKRRSKK